MNANYNFNSLLIDPWGLNNTSNYLNGLIFGLSRRVRLTVFTNYYFKEDCAYDAEIIKTFFKLSENMRRGVIRKIVRSIEYFFAYKKILHYIKKNHVEIVHFNWLLNYKQDAIMLRRIKKYCKRLVYTAHNIIPHINGKKSMKCLRRIYDACDCIVVHGESIKMDFLKLYPEFADKVFVQKHGYNLKPNKTQNSAKIPAEDLISIEKYEKIFIFFGRIFYEKGLDRLIDCWDSKRKDALLIVAGKTDENYKELEHVKKKVLESHNIIFYNRFVDDETLNYLINKSDVIVLPYRGASMSGVVFTAADFSKTVLFTDCGAIKEYLRPGFDSFMCENSDSSLSFALNKMLALSKNELKNMGSRLTNTINENCNWEDIGDTLLDYIYFPLTAGGIK